MADRETLCKTLPCRRIDAGPVLETQDVTEEAPAGHDEAGDVVAGRAGAACRPGWGFPVDGASDPASSCQPAGLEELSRPVDQRVMRLEGWELSASGSEKSFGAW